MAGLSVIFRLCHHAVSAMASSLACAEKYATKRMLWCFGVYLQRGCEDANADARDAKDARDARDARDAKKFWLPERMAPGNIRFGVLFCDDSAGDGRDH